LVKITSYNERQGSLIIAFSLMAFHSIMKYKEFRDNIEAMRNDIDSFLNRVFPGEPVIVAYRDINFNDTTIGERKTFVMHYCLQYPDFLL
jgi:hypothetical protein